MILLKRFATRLLPTEMAILSDKVSVQILNHMVELMICDNAFVASAETCI